MAKATSKLQLPPSDDDKSADGTEKAVFGVNQIHRSGDSSVNPSGHAIGPIRRPHHTEAHADLLGEHGRGRPKPVRKLK